MMSENFGFTEAPNSDGEEVTYLEAIADTIQLEMMRDPDVICLGEDVGGTFGGAFKVTKGLAEQFGDQRVINTPLAELSFTGMATGMALMGFAPDHRDAVRRLHFLSLRFYCPVRRYNPLSLGWSRTMGNTSSVGRWDPLGSFPLSEPRGLVCAHPRPEGRGSSHASRCEGSAGICRARR